MKESLIEKWNKLLASIPKRQEPIYYMSKESMKHLDQAIKEYAKVNNITIEDDKTTDSK